MKLFGPRKLYLSTFRKTRTLTKTLPHCYYFSSISVEAFMSRNAAPSMLFFYFVYQNCFLLETFYNYIVIVFSAEIITATVQLKQFILWNRLRSNERIVKRNQLTLAEWISSTGAVQRVAFFRWSKRKWMFHLRASNPLHTKNCHWVPLISNGKSLFTVFYASFWLLVSSPRPTSPSLAFHATHKMNEN